MINKPRETYLDVRTAYVVDTFDIHSFVDGITL